MKSKLGWVLGLLVVTASVGLTGCCAGKVAECNKLITVINNHGDSIKKATDKMNSSKNDSAAIEELAKTMEKAGDEINAVELKDATLKGYANEYHDTLDKGAKASRAMMAAANKNDIGGLNKAMADISAVETQEAALVTKVNGYCQH